MYKLINCSEWLRMLIMILYKDMTLSCDESEYKMGVIGDKIELLSNC